MRASRVCLLVLTDAQMPILVVFQAEKMMDSLKSVKLDTARGVRDAQTIPS